MVEWVGVTRAQVVAADVVSGLAEAHAVRMHENLHVQTFGAFGMRVVCVYFMQARM